MDAPWPHRPASTKRTSNRATVAVVGAVVSVLLVSFVIVLARSTAARWDLPERPDERPAPSAPPVPKRTATMPWRIEPATLRPELPDASFIWPVDGDFSGPYVSTVDPEAADVWVALTGGDGRENKIAVHGLDPTSGRVLWDRPMEGALCASEADAHGVACAELLDRDPATGVGRRWRLHLLDPAPAKPGAAVRWPAGSACCTGPATP